MVLIVFESVSQFFIFVGGCIFFWLFLAAIGHQSWVQRILLELLVKVFEYGSKRVKVAEIKHKERVRKLSKISEISECDTDDDENDSDEDSQKPNGGQDLTTKLNGSAVPVPNGTVPGNAVVANGSVTSETTGATAEKVRRKTNPSVAPVHTHFVKPFHLFDVSEFIQSGMQSIVDDQVTKRFQTEELPMWNLLTRTDKFYHYNSLRLAAIWFVGLLIR